MIRRSVILAVFVQLFWAATAAAVTIERLALENGPPVLVVTGQFVSGDDPAELINEVRATGATLVTFNSNGGNIRAATGYGRAIRSLGLSTFQLRAAQCASACALAFAGGVSRQAEAGSIGVHQSSFSPDTQLDGHTAVAAVQAMTAEIMAYLAEMGVDPTLMKLSLSVPPNDMRYLTAGEMQEFRVITGAAFAQPNVAAAESLPKREGVAPVARPTDMTAEEKAHAFMARFHDAWSASNEVALSFMASAYADSVEFYGATISREAVLADKRKFAERWPRRAYSVRHDSQKAYCGGTCTVTGLVEWFTHSPARGRMSSGLAEFTLTWDPATGRILAESGKVLATDRNVTGPERIIAQWHNENSLCRGGSGDSKETLLACDRRETLGAKLGAVGWCYGRPGEFGYQMNWHACDMRGQAAAPAGSGHFRPEDFSAAEVYRGPTKMPDFRKRDRAYNHFRTRIREGMKAGPNFAGRYSVIQIGCGTGCSFAFIGDNRTGRVADFPRGGEANMYMQLDYRLGSRLMAAQWADHSAGRCHVEFFEFNAEKWTALGRRDVGPLDACYNDIADNLR